MLVEGVKENDLGGFQFFLTAEVTVAARPPHLYSVGSLVTGAWESILLNECLQQHRLNALGRLPIRGDPFHDSAENHGGQVRTLNPGEDQEPAVADDPI